MLFKIYGIELFRMTSQLGGVPTVDCPSVEPHRTDIQVEFVQQWRLVMYATVIFRILGLLLNVFHAKSSA